MVGIPADIYKGKRNVLKIDVVPHGNLTFEETIVVWLVVEASRECREVAVETGVKKIMRLWTFLLAKPNSRNSHLSTDYLYFNLAATM